MLIELESLNVFQSKLLDSLSHELKTPLNGALIPL